MEEGGSGMGFCPMGDSGGVMLTVGDGAVAGPNMSSMICLRRSGEDRVTE